MKWTCVNFHEMYLFQSIPEEYQNGPMIGYYITASNSAGDLFEIAINNPNQLVQTMTLPCQQTKISIKSWGEAGNSTTVSTVSILENFGKTFLNVLKEANQALDFQCHMLWSILCSMVCGETWLFILLE